MSKMVCPKENVFPPLFDFGLGLAGLELGTCQFIYYISRLRVFHDKNNEATLFVNDVTEFISVLFFSTFYQTSVFSCLRYCCC